MKADEVVCRTFDIFFAQLHDGVRRFAGSRVAQPHRLQWTETQYVVTAVGHLFDWQTPFEVARFFKRFGFVPRQRTQIFEQFQILLFRQWNVDIVVAVAFFVARFAVHRRFID